MAVRVEERRGSRVLVIDFRYKDAKTGRPARYRKDAEIQTRAAAVAEERRLLVTLTTTGAPVVPVAVELLASTVEVSTAPTFESVVKDYLATYAVTAIKPSTKAGYEKILNGILLPRLGETPIDRIDAGVVRELDAAAVARGAKPGTRRQLQIVIRSVLGRYAVEAGLLKLAPAFPSMVRQGGKVPSAMTGAEVEAALAVVTPGHRLAFLLACDAGLRAGEVRGLRRMDVDLKAGHLVVREARCRGVTGSPKSGNEREVPLSTRLHEALGELPKGQPKDLVCVTECGKPWGEYGLIQAWRRACERAGIERWRYHDLRHFFVTELFARGVGAPTVQALAGHASLAVTARYSHTTRADLRDAVARLGQQVGNRSAEATDQAPPG